MTARAPNFVVIGAAKAGTTSLHGWLSQHPEIFVPAQKELHFFAGPWLRENSNGPGDARVLQDLAPSWDAYLAHYKEAGSARAVGDISPSYFAWWPSRDAIRERLDDPKIILLLRHPVEKAFSQYTHLLRDGRETLSFWDGLQAEPERSAKHYGALWRYLEGASYALPTQRYLEAFGPDRMQVLWFEDLVRDPSDDAAPDLRLPGHRSGGADRYRRCAQPVGGAALAPPRRPAQQSGPAPPRPPDPAAGAGGARGHPGDDPEHRRQADAGRAVARLAG